MKIFKTINCLGLLLILLISSYCGGDTQGLTSLENVNTGEGFGDLREKLIGTPFEEMESGDVIEYCDYMQGEYLTTDIPQLPIPIFLAFFNTFEENLIKEGIQLTNDSAGRKIFEVVEEWQDDARLIYKVRYIESINPEFQTNGIAYSNFYRGNCDTYASNIVADWQVAVVFVNSFSGKNLIAHELSHAFGMDGHYNVDFENDSISDPGETSLLRSGVASSIADPDLDEFTYMMTEFGNILVNAIENDDYIITGVAGSCIDHLPDELLTQIQDNYDSECN